MESSQKLPKAKATWSYELRKSFIDLCIEQVNDNQKKGTFFSKEGWNKICQEFNKRNRKEYDKKQMKNHWDSTKADWKVWWKLKECETGLGWDDEKNTVIASPEWWKDYIQNCPDAYKFRHEGIEHAQQLTTLFLEGMATGKSAWAPSEGSLPVDSAGPCRGSENECFVDLDSETQNIEEPAIDLNDDNFTFEKKTPLRRRKRKLDTYPPPEPRRRASSGSAVSQQLDRIGNICEAMANSRKVNHPEPPVTSKDCIEILDEMEEEVPYDSDLYLFACDLFLNQEQRDMFKALKPIVRLRWLQNQENKAKNK